MKPSNHGLLATMLVLCAVATCCAIIPQGPVTALLGALAVSLLAIELDRSGKTIALRIVSLGARLIPRDRREELEDEWRDHVLSVGDTGSRPLVVACSIALMSAPRLALRYRLRRRAAIYVMRVFALYTDQVEQLVITPARRQRAAGKAIDKRMVALIVLRTLLTFLASTPLSLVLGQRTRRVPTHFMTALGVVIAILPLPAAILFGGWGIELASCALGAAIWLTLLPMKVTEAPARAIAVVNRIAGEPLM